MYINCHSYFSFKYGTMSIAQLMEEAVANNISTLALTDINNTSAALEFVRQCEQHNIKPILGIDFRNGNDVQFIGIAKNNDGFSELNTLLTSHNIAKTPLPEKAPAFENCYVIYPEGRVNPNELLAHEFIGIRPENIAQLALKEQLYPKEKLVILHPITFRNKTDFNLHRLLRAIDNNVLLSKLPPSEVTAPEEIMRPNSEVLKMYWDYPHLIENTRQLLQNCAVKFEFGKSKNKKIFDSSSASDQNLLRELALEGFAYRYPNASTEAQERLEKELKVINNMDFCTYFLINWDIVRYARSKGYYYVGRGSGANSIVAYCLRITDVDPIDLDLYFERFINLYRSSPPDFDIDFSWKDRDDITTYIMNKYGQKNAVLMGAYNTFKEKSARRELAKVFGIPKLEIDKFIKASQPNKHDDHLKHLIFKYAELLNGFPSHLSIHAGGILISERPISEYTACNFPPKGFPTTHFDMITAEDIGLYKFDILSQRGLGHIKDTMKLVQQNRGIDIDIHNIDAFKNDPKIKELIREGRAIGCFYVESPTMRMLLTKLKCDDYKTLVAASSIIRPGVAKSGMMTEFVKRHHDPDGFEYIHPRMKDILEETHGVMVYQEDVIKVAHHFAGLDLAEADVLRRGMSGKFRSRTEFKRIEKSFFENCRKRGYPEETTQEVWRQIESFAGYSFSKAHSASYAVESYQSLFLKAHYPKEFMVAVINNFGGFYRTEQYVHEARMNGANIEAPCLNRSNYLTCIDGDDVFLGFIHVQELTEGAVKQIARERKLNGFFNDFDDVVKRLPMVGLEQLTILIRVGALRFTGLTKKELLWESRLKLARTTKQFQAPIASRGKLFDLTPKMLKLPELTYREHEDSFDEMELLGFALCSPFKLLKKPLFSSLLAKDFVSYIGQTVSITGYLVTIKYTRTRTGEQMQFATFLDEQGCFFDTVHFPKTAKQFPFRGRGIYEVKAKVVAELGFYSLEVESLQKLPIISDPRFSEEADQNTIEKGRVAS